jgi:PAS domain S-box-containing protein
MFILILSAGIGAGSLANFCIWRALAVNFLFLTFAPGMITGLATQQAELLPVILAIALFVVYLLVQIKNWNVYFWDSLITAYLFEKQAEKLVDANSKLAEVIEKEQNSRLEVEMGRVKIRELFNLTSDAIVICGLDGRVLDANRSALSIIANGRGAAVNTLPRHLFSMPDDSPLSFQDHWQEVVNGKEGDFECRVTPPGEQGTLFVQVNLRRMTWQEEQIIFVTLRDITVRKQMEKTLALTRKTLSESEGYLQAILLNVELPMYCKDLNGCYLTVNKPFEELCCLTREELQGKNDLQVFPENVGRFFSFRDADISEIGESLELEGTFTFGGQKKNLLVHKFPLRENGGRIYATAGICTDVTTMQKALHTAQLANKAKSEFLANMSHELRTPMHSILSIARLGLKRVDRSPREKLGSYFQMIITSGDQLLELLSDLLDLSTLEADRACYSLQEYDLAKDLEKVVSEFRVMMAESGIKLNYESPAYPAAVRYDKIKIYQVLRNLLTNAMKFTPSQKEITVVLKKDTLEKSGDSHPAWKVMVIDQGAGIEKDELGLVFGKFIQGSRTSMRAGGVGLGLSICKRIIEDHHGIIWAEKNEQEGATFCFLLPALE